MKILQRLRHETDEYKNKSGKFLESLIEQNKERTVFRIKRSAGRTTQTPEEINNRLRSFF